MHALAVSLVAGGALIAADIALTKIKTALDFLKKKEMLICMLHNTLIENPS